MEIVSDNYSQTQIFVKNRYIVSENSSRYDIRSSKNKAICFQTKKLSFYINREKGFVLVFFAKEDPLVKTLKKIEKKVLYFLEKSGYSSSKFTWYSSFNSNDDSSSNNFISMFFRISRKALIFDHRQKSLEIDQTTRSFGRLLLALKHIWISESNSRKLFGLQIELEQFEIDTDYVFDDYAFVENESETSITFETHPTYKKYFSMLEKGVPKMAVAQKITMNGDPPEILNYSAKDSVPLSIGSSNSPLNSSNSDIRTRTNSNLDIKAINGFDRSQLNKVDKSLTKKKFTPPQNGAAPPSLETILNCLNKLKPTIKQNEINTNNDKKLGYLDQVGLFK